MRATGGSAYWPIITLAVISCFGVILTAGYMLDTMQKIFFGPEKAEYKGFPEVDQREVVVLTPLAIMAILLGILPTVFFFTFTDTTVKGLFGLFSTAAQKVAGL
jgi:NADH-quinone oxidoreductase subunit M